MPPTYSIYSNTTFGIQKVVQNSYINSENLNIPANILNTVLGEYYSDIINVTEVINGVSVTKLYIAYISETNPFLFGVTSYTATDTSGSIYIARFDVNLNLEYIFRSGVLNTTTGGEYTPKLIYGSRKLFLAYLTEGTVNNNGGNISSDSRLPGDNTKDLVLACLEPFTYEINDATKQNQPISIKDNLDILWLKQNNSFNNLTIASQVSDPCLAYDASNTILYCSFKRTLSETDTNINIVAVLDANGLITNNILSYSNLETRLITLDENSIGLNKATSKESLAAITVDDKSYLYLAYRTNADNGTVIGSGTKTTTLTTNNRYVLVQFAPPPNINDIFIEPTNYWSIRNITSFSLTEGIIAGDITNIDIYADVNIVFYKKSIIISSVFFSTLGSNSNPIATRMNLDSNYNFGTFQISAAARRTGTKYSASFSRLPNVRMAVGLKDPIGNDNLFLIYDTYINIGGNTANTKMNLNIARYEINSEGVFQFKDYTATTSTDIVNNTTLLTDLEGINLMDNTTGVYKNSKSPSVCVADGCLIIAYETDGASYYYDSKGTLIQNIYGGNETFNTNYDIAIAKVTPFKPNAPRSMYLTESINFVEIKWAGNLIGTNAVVGVNNTIIKSPTSVVEWWPPTDGSKWGYRISYRKTGEEDFNFIDLFDISGKDTSYYSDGSGEYKVRIHTKDSSKDLDISSNFAKYNTKPLEKGYQYEFNVSALLNGAPGDKSITQGMPVDGYVINTITGLTIDKYLPSNQLTPSETDLFKDETNNVSEIKVSLTAGKAYNIAIRSFVKITDTFTNYSPTDQSGIVIPRYDAPTNITLTSGPHYIKVQWNTVSGENVDVYEIQYSTDILFATYSTLIHPSKLSSNTTTTLTNYLVYSESPYTTDDRDISLNTQYYVRVRAIGGKNINSINGITITGDKYGYKVYGIYGNGSSSAQATALSTPITSGISGESGFLESNSVTNNSIELRWLQIATPTVLSLMINGYRYNVTSTSINGLFKITTSNKFYIDDVTISGIAIKNGGNDDISRATISGTVTFNQTTVPYSGMKSILFGISGYIQPTNLLQYIKLYKTEFTYTFWINIPSGVTQDIIPIITTSQTSSSSGYNIHLVKNNISTNQSYYNLQFTSSISGIPVNKITCELGSELFIGKGWKHVSVIFNNTDIHVHIQNNIDNAKKSIYETCVIYPDISNTNATLLIGGYFNSSALQNYYLPNGTYLSNFRFYGKALSEEQIKLIKQDTTNSTLTSILSQPYKFNITDASMNSWVDASSNGVLKPSITPGTQYNIILFGTNTNTGDPSGRFLARKVITLGATPIINDVSFSEFNPNAIYNTVGSLPSSTIKYNTTTSLDLSNNMLYFKPNNYYFDTYKSVSVNNSLTEYTISSLYGGNSYEIYAVSNTGKDRPYYRPYIIRNQIQMLTSVDISYTYFRIIVTHVAGKSQNVSLTEIGISGKVLGSSISTKITPTTQSLSSSPLKSGTLSHLYDNNNSNNVLTSDSALFYSNTDEGSFATTIAPSTIVDNITTIYGAWFQFETARSIITGLQFAGTTPSALPDGIVIVGSNDGTNWRSIYSNGYMTNPLVYTGSTPYIAQINIATAGLVSTTNIVSSNILSARGTVPSFIYNTTSITPPVDIIVAVNRRNTNFNLILTNIDHNRNVSNYTVKLYKNSDKTGIPDKIITGISITDNTYRIEQLEKATTYYIKFIANIDITPYEFTTQSIGYKTTDITVNDISVNSIVAGPQKLQFYLTRRVRSVSNENILIRYIPDIIGNGTFSETNQIIKRFYVIDSSMIELTGLFPQRNISGAYIRVEYFVSHTNDFNSSNEIQILPSLLRAVKPGYFYPIAPKLSSGTPLPLNTTYTEPGKATITWSPNQFKINYPNENSTEFINSASLPVYN